MSDDKAEQIDETACKYMATLQKLYRMGTPEGDIPSEDSRSMSQTAFNNAREVHHPRYSSSHRGQGNKHDDDYWEKRRKIPVDQRDYTGGFWDDDATDDQMKRLRTINAKTLEQYNLKHKDPNDAVTARYNFISGWFEAMFGKPLPKNYAEDGSGLTKGEASYIPDKMDELILKKVGK